MVSALCLLLSHSSPQQWWISSAFFLLLFLLFVSGIGRILVLEGGVWAAIFSR